VLARELDRSKSKRLPLSLAFLDLDRFKLVNDEHGHLIGSELLCHIGARLKELARPQDLCFRYGGDEFVILMPDTSAETAMILARALHQALMATEFRMNNGLKLRVSASVGLSTAPRDGDTVHTIIGIADTRMYSVKATGRGSLRGA
jgi:diguanylate cyclase (GGDEF)-like protein